MFSIICLLCHVLGDLTLIDIPFGCEVLLICGEPRGLLTGPPGTRLISGEKDGPLTGVVGADSDCLLVTISSANHTLLLPLGGVPEEKMSKLHMQIIIKKNINFHKK